MPLSRALLPLIRFGYRQFYNRFAFTYDAVSAVVSRGEWHEWTRSAIPYLRGPRLLEMAFGTGSLHLDLIEADYAPIGVDLSPYMIGITQRKARRRGLETRLVRARVQRLPFPDAHFDSIVMTFPPGFVTDEHAMEELWRVLATDGCLIWVDAPYLYPRDVWTRFLNWAFHVIDGNVSEPTPSDLLDWIQQTDTARSVAEGAHAWEWRVEKIERVASYVHVIIGTKQNG